MMNTISTESAPAFVGWHRRNSRSRWVPVCHGPSAEIVLGKLLDDIRGGDKCVLASGVDANDREPTMRRRRF
jgi:hypothetical protein